MSEGFSRQLPWQLLLTLLQQGWSVASLVLFPYDKLLKDAKQRNRTLFDKLFEPKSKELKHPELIGE